MIYHWAVYVKMSCISKQLSPLSSLFSFSPKYLSVIHPHFFHSHFTHSSLWMRVHFKASLPPSGWLSRSDVLSWEEWRRCIHESRWCSPQERNRLGGWGGVGQKGNGTEMKWKEMRKLERKWRWLRETDEEGERERGQIDEWMFVRTTPRQMPIYCTKQVFRMKAMRGKRLEGVHSDSKFSPVFIFKPLLRGEWKTQKQTQQIIFNITQVIICTLPEDSALSRIIAVSSCNNRPGAE